MAAARPDPGLVPRTCDTVGACPVVPRFPWVPEALARGDTLRRPACVHWTGDPLDRRRRDRGAARPRGRTRRRGRTAGGPAARAAHHGRRAGDEQQGIPPEALALLDLGVEIPLEGTGAGLNVAVTGSPALHSPAGVR